MAEEITMDRLVRAFTKIRDERARNKAAFERDDKKLTDLQERIEAELLRKFNELGGNIQNVRTTYGTAYRDQEVYASVDDWAKFWVWMKENDAFDVMERRIKRTFIQEYMKENDGKLPPSVAVRTVDRIRIRTK